MRRAWIVLMLALPAGCGEATVSLPAGEALAHRLVALCAAQHEEQAVGVGRWW